MARRAEITADFFAKKEVVGKWPQQVMSTDGSKDIVWVEILLWSDGSVTWVNVVK